VRGIREGASDPVRTAPTIWTTMTSDVSVREMARRRWLACPRTPETVRVIVHVEAMPDSAPRARGSQSGMSVILSRRKTRQSGARATKARARWDAAFFSAAVYSPAVRSPLVLAVGMKIGS
jgi:hypothetical protein